MKIFNSKMMTRIAALLIAVFSLVAIDAVGQDLDPVTANPVVAPAGTYVLAMDNALQPATNGLFNIKAYGMAITFLNNKIGLHWVIKSGKAKDAADFTGTATRLTPSYQAASSLTFYAGPILIFPSDTGLNNIRALVATFNTGNSNPIYLYQLTTATTVDVRYILNEKPRAAILNDGTHANIMTNYMALASVPGVNYEVLSTGKVLTNPDTCFTFAAEPHNDNPVQAVVDSINSFVVNSGGNFLANCAALTSYENLIVNFYQSTAGMTQQEPNNYTYSYPHADIAYNQFQGDFDATNIGGTTHSYVLKSGSRFINNGDRYVRGLTGADTLVMDQSMSKKGTGVGHIIFYLGGHDFGTGGFQNTTDGVNGMRSFFNAMLTPSSVGSCAFLSFNNDLAATKTASSTSITLGQKDTFTIIVKNTGPSTAVPTGVTATDALPAGFTYVSSTVNKGTYNSTTGAWSIGSMPLNESDTLTVIGTSNTVGTITNKVVITKDNFDFNQTNDTATAVVTVYNCASANAGRDTAICLGKSTVLGASPAVTGGKSPYTYTWTPSTGLSATNVANPTLTPTGAGTFSYVLQVADALGCGNKDTVVVTVNPTPAATATATVATLCSGGTLSLTSGVTSGTSPFTYVWSGPDTFSRTAPNPSRGAIIPAMSGVYNLTVTDTKGCTATAATSFVTINQSPTVTASANSSAYCTGGTIGLTATPSPSGVYSYSWSGPNSYSSTGSPTPSLSATSAAAGVYTVTITDGNNCTAAGSTSSLVIHTSPTVTASSTSASYCTGSTISLNSTITGGTTPFGYSWSGPGFATNNTSANPTIANATTAMSGVYTVTVTDNFSCTATGSTASIPVYQSPTTIATSSAAAYCAGTTISLHSAGSGGSSPYTYVWSGPAAFSSHSQDTTRPNATTAMTGIYTVTATDAHQCTATASTSTVTVNAGFTVNASSNSAVCAGGTLNLTSSPSAGAAPFTYVWSGPDTFSRTTANPSRGGAIAAMAGTYSVTITDNNTCSNTATTVVVVNAATVVNVTSNSPVCVGDTIKVLATPTSGATPFAYTWSGPASFSASIGNPIRTNAQTNYGGTYAVTVTDNNGCSGTGSTSVSINTLPIVAAGSTSPYCSGGTISLTSTVTSAASPFSYVWAGPDTFSRTAANPTRGNIITAMGGTYNLTVTDNNGCKASASTLVTVNASPTVVASSDKAAYCSGATINLTATPSPTGSYSYSWSGPNSFASTSATPTVLATSAAAGVYTVTITNSNNCTATASTSSIVVYTSPTIAASSLTPTYCSGATISLSSTVTGGAPTYSYSWSGPLFSSTQANPSISNATTGMSGVYSVTVTDNNTCTATGSTAAITVYQSPTATASSPSPAYCATTTITLNSSASNGASPYTYVWSGPVSFTSHAQDTTRSAITTSMSGVYTVTVTDSHLCTASASTNSITVNPGFSVTASSNTPVCAGGTINLSASPSAGSSPFAYSWSGPSYTSIAQNPSRSGASAAMAGLYSVTVTDNNGCSNTATTTVVVNPATTINVTSNSPVCVGDSISLHATPSSGSSPFTYTWSGPLTYSASVANPGRANAIPTYAGTYAVTATDVNGCSGTGSASVVVNPLPAVTASSTSPGYCVNGTIQLNATPSLGTPPYVTYNWSGPSYSSNQQNPGITPVTTAMAGSYTVTLTDSKGCSASSSVSVAVYTLPVVSAGADQTSCSGENVTLGGSPTASGGNPPYTYTWTNGASAVPNPTVNPTVPTTYTVTVTDTKLCSASASANVSINAKPTVNAGLDQTIPSCSLVGTTIGGSPTATGGGGPYTYLWAPAAGLSRADTSNPVVQGIGATTSYTVTVTDANGCTASDLVIVNVTGSSLALSISASGTTAWCAAGSSSVTFTANPTGGNGTYTYSWTGSSLTGSTTATPIANPSVAGTYTYALIVTDGTGCQVGDTTSITVFPKPTANAGAVNYNICRGDSVTLGGNPTANGGTSPYTYAWTNGAASVSSPSVSPNSGTSYTVVVTDSNNCTATASTFVTVRSNPAANAGLDVNLPACSPTGIQIGGSPTASGGAGSYSFAWSPAGGLSSTSIANPIVQGITTDQTYTVTVSDANGCSSTDQVAVHVTNNPPAVTIVPGSSTSWCANSGSSVLLSASVTGGTGSITYSWSGTSISPLTSSSATANPSAANTYTYNVTITDGFNCTATNNIAVTVYELPVAQAGTGGTICNGDSITIGGSPTASGGHPAYTYLWNNGAASVADPKVAPTGTTTYTVTVTDTKLCSATANTTVNVNPRPTANAGVDQSIPVCSLVGTVIGGSPVATGGTSPFTYKWSPTAGLSSPDSSNPTVKGIGATTPYTVTVTDANGCSSSDIVIVTVAPSTLASNITANGPTAWCAAGSSTVTLTANATGGVGSYTYSWTGSNLSATTTTSTIANPSVAGTYTYHVTVTDGVGCQVVDTDSIVVYPKPTASVNSPGYFICRGDSVTLGGSPTASGGTGTYTYAWTNGAASVSNPTVDPINNTTYTVTVTDQNLCSASASSSVTVRSNPVADAGPDVNLPACSPTGIKIGGSPTATSGAGSYSYAWSPSTGLSSTIVANPIVQGITTDQTYTVTVSDLNGCSSTDVVIVHVTNSPPSVNIFAGGPTSWCANSNGSVFLAANVTGGTGAITYAWSGTFINPTNAPTATVNPNVANTYTYTVTITDGFNCTATDSKTITVNALPSASAGLSGYTICHGDSVTIGGNPTATGGSGTYTYVWNNGAASVANPSVKPVSNTTYSVVVTDGNNCTATASTAVTVRTNPIADAGQDKTQPSCTPTGLQIGGSPTASGGGGAPFSYAWSPAVGLSSTTTANPSVTGLLADTTYTVTVTDVNGCKATDQVIMHIINNTPSVNITSSNSTSWCAGTNSSTNLTANVTGGTSPLSYSWSGTNINSVNSQVATVYPNSTGHYSYPVVVTDGFGCTATSTQVVTVNAIPTVNAGTPIQSICTGSYVTIGGNPTATGGTPPYTYSWNSGANAVANPSVNPVNSTTYIVTVTDSVGCFATASATVLVRPTVHADAGPDKSITSCSNACTTLGGSPAASGGSGTLTYAWSPATGLSSTTVANPTACGVPGSQVYTLVVTDTSGCTASDQVAITIVPSSLTAEAGTGGTTCLNSGDSVMLGGFPTAVGGVPAYTYTWSPTAGLNLVNPANPVAYPTVTTLYHLTVTDANGCMSFDSAQIRVFQPVQAYAGPDTTICYGSAVTLGGNPVGTGGTGGYTYLWSPSLNVAGITQSNPTASPFITTDYSVVVTDSNGCHATDHAVVTVRLKPSVQAGPDKTLLLACTLDSVTLGGSPTVSEGTAPFTYAWSPAVGLNSTNVPNPTVSNLTSTQTYTIVVTDSLGCTGSDQVVVSTISSTLQAFHAGTQYICGGPASCLQLGGLPTASGGYSPYTYAWSGSLADSTLSNPTACPSSSTVYALTVTDSKGCTATTSESVVVKSPPVVSAGRDTAICLGQSVVLGGSPTATGGTGHGYTYLWSPATGISSAVVANPVSTTTVTTTYNVVVTDSNGCSSTGTVVVTVRPAPVANAGPDKTISLCAHDSVIIGSIPAASGGTPPYAYVWSPAVGLSSTVVPNPTVAGITQTGSYQLLVTDSFGCTSTDYVVVNLTQTTLQAQAGNVNVLCAAAGTTVTIGGTPTASGGAGPYVFSWSPSAGLSSTTIPNPIATVTTSTTYYVTVTDAKGCVAVDSVKININAAPTANAGTDTTVCQGFGKTLGGSPTASGGTAPYQYSWTPTTGLSANNTSNPSVFPATTTTYQVLVTDSNGCQASDVVTITINQNPTANAGSDVSITSCIGDSATLGGSPSASGGSGSYIYSWSPATGLSSSTAANPVITGLQTSGLYGLTVTDANGCSASDATFISVVRSTLSANAGNDASICAGANTLVTLGGNPTTTGGTGPYTYAWSNSATLSSGTVSNPNAIPTTTTGYTVTVTDAKGCQATDSVTVFINTVPVANAGNDTSVCAGNGAIVGGNPTASGSGPFTYVWSPSTGVSNVNASNPLITPAGSNTYAVTVTDVHGCTATDNLYVTVRQNPTADAGPDKSLIACNGDSVMIGGSPAATGGQPFYSYQWSPPSGVSSSGIPNPYVSHLGSSSTFTLLVTDQYGCTASDQVFISVTNSTLFANAGNTVSVCQGTAGLIIIGGTPTATGGTPSYTYTWSPAAGLSSTTSANPAALPTQTTVYTVVVKDGAGCIATDTMSFFVNPKPVVNAGANDTVCQGVCVALGGAPTADGNPALNTYSWAPGSSLNNPALANPTACPTATTRYNVTVTNQYNCSATAGMTVKVNAAPTVNAGPDQNVVACPLSCVALGGSPTATGGLAPYTYSWSPALSLDTTATSNPILCNPKIAVTYTVTVTDANGCTATDGVQITPVASSLTADAGPDKSICAGQSTCITIGGNPAIVGGTAPYTVHWSPTANFCGSSLISNPQVNPTNSTIYTFFVVDAQGCSSRDTMEVYANPAVTAIVRPDTSICYGSAAVLGGNPSTGGGGTAPYTYAWSPTLGISNSTSGNPTVNTLVTTSYCVTVTDSVGCSSSACEAINVTAPLIADAGPDKTISGCPNASVVIGGSPAVRGGSGNYTYAWTPATGLDSTSVANPHVTHLGTSTVYTLVVTDRLNGCSSSDQVSVTVTGSTLTVNAGSDQFLCYDNHTGVQIGGIPTVSGGQGPYTYHWSPASGLSDTSAANPIALPTATTTYALSVTDAIGCSLVDTVKVTVVQRTPVAIVGLNSKFCLNASNVPLVGSPVGGTFSGPGVAGNTFEPSQIGVGTWCIRYTYVDPVSGCSSDTVQCVTVDSLVALSVTGYKPTYCHKDSAVTLVGSPAGGVFSGPGVTGNVFNPANANTGSNTITYSYTDTVYGCSNTMQFGIFINAVPTLSIASSDSLVCPGAPVSLSAQYSTDVFNIAWSDATGTIINSGLNAFTVNPTAASHCYIATAVNNAGCVTRDTICISQLDCHIHGVNESCESDSMIINDTLTVRVIANDSLPASGSDTIVTIKTAPSIGTATVNSDHTISYASEHGYSGTVEFSYQVCVVVRGFTVCDTADVCITVVDTTIKCHFPNTITPNNDGVNDQYEVSCNGDYPNAEIRIYDRWGAEVWRSMGHYNNDWNGYNQQGILVPNGTYFYMYYFNDGTNRMKKGFIDVLR